MRYLIMAALAAFFTSAYAGPFGISGQYHQGGLIPDDGSWNKNDFTCQGPICHPELGPKWPIIWRVYPGQAGAIYNQSANPPAEHWHTVDVSPFLPDGVTAHSVNMNVQMIITPDGGADTNQMDLYLRKPGSNSKNSVCRAITRSPQGARDNCTVSVQLVDNKLEMMWTQKYDANGWAMNGHLNYYIQSGASECP